MERLEENVFYTLEKAVKAYRQFAQRGLSTAGLDITLDQWLVLKTVKQQSDATQQQIAAMVFKDVASVTRIVEILVTKGYLERSFLASDRRRQQLSVTELGDGMLQKVHPISLGNRKAAFSGIDASEIEKLESSLQSIIKNVS
ncbi:MarR family winged helix-turn-helix transcriptional regulator [Flavobacterium sp.]|uniref:MarR family winged helix-turn-helix transcriptional regulator n=1 Tax=Flavobacterium sp. TaxID=239 RepID=UPI001216D6F6|nr:MarR family winged helix-turn-helix transcriptional regulator [Flavobacterium sp.]RZJ73861.1 MAG: MarR family transcriptional regulator [Flavobacterium sp.]